MGIPVMIIGESGVGKTYAIKNLDPEKIGIFLCEKSRLPFRKRFNTYYVRNMKRVDENNKEQIVRQSIVIQTVLRDPKKKIYVIDDSQYLLANEFFDRANEPDDVIVYFLHHPETDANTGKVKAKTIGRMLDEKLTVEGCFNIVLVAKTDGTDHWFETQSDGTNTAKSPEDMFEPKIPNDLKLVDDTIRQYYELGAV